MIDTEDVNKLYERVILYWGDPLHQPFVCPPGWSGKRARRPASDGARDRLQQTRGPPVAVAPGSGWVLYSVLLALLMWLICNMNLQNKAITRESLLTEYVPELEVT